MIDFKIRHIINELSDHNKSRIHVFSCLFYSKLCEATNDASSHALVTRWTKNVNLFDKDFVLVPVNMSYHWSLTVIVRPGLLLVCKRLTSSLPSLSHIPSVTFIISARILLNLLLFSPSCCLSSSNDQPPWTAHPRLNPRRHRSPLPVAKNVTPTKWRQYMLSRWTRRVIFPAFYSWIR